MKKQTYIRIGVQGDDIDDHARNADGTVASSSSKYKIIKSGGVKLQEVTDIVTGRSLNTSQG